MIPYEQVNGYGHRCQVYNHLTLPTGGDGVTLRDVEFIVSFWPANEEEPSLPDLKLVMLVKDHVSGRKARFGMGDLFGW